MLDTDARPLVGNLDDPVVAGLPHLDLNRRADGAVFDRVVDEVLDRLPQEHRIGLRGALRRFQQEALALALRQNTQLAHAPEHQLVEPHRHALHRRCIALRAREFQ